MKILIAVDIPERKYGDSVLSKYDKDVETILNKDEVLLLPFGTTICFQKKYIKTNRDSDEFFEAEFYGVLEK
jgi:hypothetical protein